jgi:hypothetical protein
MLLTDCKALVDAGKTAKHLRWRSILHYLVRKEGAYYGRQAEGYINPDGILIVKPDTTFYSTWQDLIDSFNGYYAGSEWEITDDPFEDYLPPERKTAP